MTERRARVVVVTGATGGIGNAIATHLAKKGFKVYGTSREPSTHQKKADEFFELVPLELADDASAARLADLVLGKEGGIDALVCCAGTGLSGPLEDTSVDDLRSAVECNVLGTAKTIKAFLPSMRAAGSGRVVVVGARAGLVPLPFQSVYSACEFALEGFVESLRYEISPFGLEACLLEAWDIRTGFAAAFRTRSSADDSSPYRRLYDGVAEVMAGESARGLDPIAAARLVLGLLNARRLPPRLHVGPLGGRLAIAARRFLPAGPFERLMRLWYRLP